ncbi:hypothetical protein BH11PLA2_BH11PLA2_32540 [soil metagenome]
MRKTLEIVALTALVLLVLSVCPTPAADNPKPLVAMAHSPEQTFVYKGRSFAFEAATPELADVVRRAIMAEVDGTAPKAMPAAIQPGELSGLFSGPSSQAPACRLVWNGRQWVQQCPNAR